MSCDVNIIHSMYYINIFYSCIMRWYKLSNSKIDAKKLDLLKRSNNLLEITKTDVKMYERERKLLFEFSINPNVNYEQWEYIVCMLENIIELDKKLKSKESDYRYLKSLASFLRSQKTRIADLKDEKIIFKVLDKYNNSHLFLTRNNAEKFIKDNSDLFTNTDITIIDNKNDELQHLLDLIARNF